MPARSEAPFAAAIGRRPHSLSEIIGSGERRSCSTNKPVATTAKAVISVISLQLDVDSAVRSAMIAAMAMVKTPALRWSILRRSCLMFSWRKIQKPAAARMPMGTLSQKIHAQEKCWMISPPASGPRTAEIAQTLAR